MHIVLAKVGIATDGLPHPSKVHLEILHDAAAVSFRQDPSGDSSWRSSHLIENNKLVDPVMRNPTPYTLPLNYNTNPRFNGRLEPPTQRLWSPTSSLWTTTSAQGPSHISSVVSVINQWGGSLNIQIKHVINVEHNIMGGLHVIAIFHL